MNRITIEEFLTDIREHQSVLRDGHELGLIIDESNGVEGKLDQVMVTIAQHAPSLCVSIEDLCKPSAVLKRVSQETGSSAVIMIVAYVPLLSRHYTELQSLVSHHALEEWTKDGTEREMVRFEDSTRFILVMSRTSLEETVRSFPPIRGILGTSLSIDNACAKEVAYV